MGAKHPAPIGAFPYNQHGTIWKHISKLSESYGEYFRQKIGTNDSERTELPKIDIIGTV